MSHGKDCKKKRKDTNFFYISKVLSIKVKSCLLQSLTILSFSYCGKINFWSKVRQKHNRTVKIMGSPWQLRCTRLWLCDQQSSLPSLFSQRPLLLCFRDKGESTMWILVTTGFTAVQKFPVFLSTGAHVSHIKKANVLHAFCLCSDV